MKTDIKGFSESEVPKLIQIFQKMKYTEQKFKPVQMDQMVPTNKMVPFLDTTSLT